MLFVVVRDVLMIDRNSGHDTIIWNTIKTEFVNRATHWKKFRLINRAFFREWIESYIDFTPSLNRLFWLSCTLLSIDLTPLKLDTLYQNWALLRYSLLDLILLTFDDLKIFLKDFNLLLIVPLLLEDRAQALPFISEKEFFGVPNQIFSHIYALVTQHLFQII